MRDCLPVKAHCCLIFKNNNKCSRVCWVRGGSAFNAFFMNINETLDRANNCKPTLWWRDKRGNLPTSLVGTVLIALSRTSVSLKRTEPTRTNRYRCVSRDSCLHFNAYRRLLSWRHWKRRIAALTVIELAQTNYVWLESWIILVFTHFYES